MPRLRQEDAPDRYDDKSRGPRLQRVLADAGVAARRTCEELILAGEVEVNGRLVDTLPAFVDPEQDRITVKGRPIKRPGRKVYVLLNKPPRTITTTADEPEMDRKTVTDLVDHPLAARLFPVGRLDYDTTGLLLLTNDGELANKLTHPRFGVTKTYHALVKGKLTDDDAKQIAQGIYLAERKSAKAAGVGRASRVEVSIFKRDKDKTILELRLLEGRNRQVRHMLSAVGCPVKKLERVTFGPLVLKGIPRGGWREVTKPELDALRRAIALGKDAEPARINPRKPTQKGGPKGTKRPARGQAPEPAEPTGPTIDPKRIKAAVATSDRPAPNKGARRLTSGRGR